MNTASSESRDTFFFIPHTHWEGAVFKTRDDYLDMGLPNILRALRLLEQYPNYRFTLDQVCYVRPFLERYPEQEEAFRRFVAEGRLEIVGGTDVMLDVNMPGGESFIRQVIYGKRWFREKLGIDVTVGWQLDTFGHHAQMPQLLKLAGYKSFWFFRGVADWDVPAEFLWEGIDGSRVPAFWLPHGYAVVYGSPQTPAEFRAFFEERFQSLAPFSRGRGRVGLAGADVCTPEAHVAPLVEQFNREPETPFSLRLSVPTEYEAFVERTRDRTVVSGELNPIFQGTYSSRIELKQQTRELERQLTTAEKLGALLSWLGSAPDERNVWRAWEPMLFNQAHDLMSGVMTDYVYEDTVRSFDFSRRLAEEEVGRRLRNYVQHIDTRGEGSPVVVFNPLGWARTDIVLARVGFTDGEARDVRLLGPDGAPVPVELVEARRDGDGVLVEAEIAFVARDVPALGHCVYRLCPSASPSCATATESPGAGPAVLENEHCRLELDASGAIASLVLKPDGREMFRGPANVIAREEDHGDLWELYRPLDGGSRIAMREPHGVPQVGQAHFSNEQAGEPVSLRTGPVFSEFMVNHAFGDRGAFGTRVRVYAGLRRIDIRTRLRNEDEFVRYRALFPTCVEDGTSVHEIPFGSVARPVGIEFPAQNWVDYSTGEGGIALLNRGLPGNNVSDGTLMLSLCRSTRIVAYGFGGGYEPGMSSDTGLQLGNELTFDYALMPHAGDWRRAGVYREGMEFGQPLIAFKAASHAGDLPPRWGFLDISQRNVVVSSLTQGDDDGVLLRLYEAEGQAAQGLEVTLAGKVTSAAEVDFLGDHLCAVEPRDGTVPLDFRPFEIKTLRIRCCPGTRPPGAG